MNWVLPLIKIPIISLFQITQTHENQITYIRYRRILEPLDKKSNCKKWLETLEGSTKEKSIQCRACCQTQPKNLRSKNKCLVGFVTPCPLTQS